MLVYPRWWESQDRSTRKINNVEATPWGLWLCGGQVTEEWQMSLPPSAAHAQFIFSSPYTVTEFGECGGTESQSSGSAQPRNVCARGSSKLHWRLVLLGCSGLTSTYNLSCFSYTTHIIIKFM